jgi:hypothetical protein
MLKLYAAGKSPLAFNWATKDGDISTILGYEGQISIFKLGFFLAEIIQNYLPAPVTDLVNGRLCPMMVLSSRANRKIFRFFVTLGGPVWQVSPKA